MRINHNVTTTNTTATATDAGAAKFHRRYHYRPICDHSLLQAYYCWPLARVDL